MKPRRFPFPLHPLFPSSPLPLLFFSLLLLFVLNSGCNSCTNNGKPKIVADRVRIKDYGKALFSLDTLNLQQGLISISNEYSFFTGNNPDTASVAQIRDFINHPFNRDLFERYEQAYPDLAFLEKELSSTFSLIKAEKPGFATPDVYTYVSGLLYELPVSYLDSVLIIGLDMYLGSDFGLYRAAGLPLYMVRRMDREYIVPECARQVAFYMLPDKMHTKTFLDQMILHGKILYAMDKFLPNTADSIKIGYTANQLEWCKANEKEVWMLFIDQEMLYRTDAFLLSRFIQDGPFTSGLPEGSPAMLGRWIGWQIVRSYMQNHPDADLRQLLELDDAQKILSLSGYKPKK